MKEILGYIILSLICIFLFFELALMKKDVEILELNLNRKELVRLYEGPSLYKLKGLKTRVFDKKAKVRPLNFHNGSIDLVIDLKGFHQGVDTYYLLKDTLIHHFYSTHRTRIEDQNLYWPKSRIVHVQFGESIGKQFVLTSISNKNTFEYEEKRFLQSFELNPNEMRFDLVEGDLESKLIDFDCYEFHPESYSLVKEFFEKTRYNLRSHSSIILLPNPLTNLVELVIDFSSLEKNSGLSWEDYQDDLFSIKSFEIKDSRQKIFRDTIYIDSIWNMSNEKYFKSDIFIAGGTALNVKKNVLVEFESCRLNFNGTKENPIEVKGSSGSSLVFRDDCIINMKNVHIQHLDAPQDKCESYPAAITFYNSSVRIDSCSFSDNQRGDDYLNFFKSTFEVNNSSFRNVRSDAIDSDFSEGEIKSSIFINIGNDAVDCSGSNVTIVNSQFEKVEDKAISAGEKSSLKISDSRIVDSSIGLVCKDGSSLTIDSSVILLENALDFAIFSKKNFYEQPMVDLPNFSLDSFRYLIENKSIVRSKDSLGTLTYTEKVRDKLYGNIYGRASK